MSSKVVVTEVDFIILIRRGKNARPQDIGTARS